MPPFVRTGLLSGRTDRVRYLEDDPSKEVSETPCDPGEAELYPRTGLSGSGAVEIKLALILTARERPPPREGDCFCIPVPDGARAVGVIARLQRPSNPRSILAYFFGPYGDHDVAPSKVEMPTNLSAADAILVRRVGYSSLRDGFWPVIGRLEPWSREAWPMPQFVRTDPETGRTYKVTYADDDPGKRIRTTPCDSTEAKSYPRDGLFGWDSVAVDLMYTYKEQLEYYTTI